MNIINTEMLVSALFVLGFDKVDPLLFTYTLAHLSKDNTANFEFIDSSFSPLFDKIIDYTGGVFSLKEGIALETVVTPNLNNDWTLRKALSTNKELLRSLNFFVFKEIVMKKIDSLGLDRIDQLGYLFSDKEITLVGEMFGADDNNIFVKKRVN